MAPNQIIIPDSCIITNLNYAGRVLNLGASGNEFLTTLDNLLSNYENPDIFIGNMLELYTLATIIKEGADNNLRGLFPQTKQYLNQFLSETQALLTTISYDMLDNTIDYYTRTMRADVYSFAPIIRTAKLFGDIGILDFYDFIIDFNEDLIESITEFSENTQKALLTYKYIIESYRQLMGVALNTFDKLPQEESDHLKSYVVDIYAALNSAYEGKFNYYKQKLLPPPRESRILEQNKLAYIRTILSLIKDRGIVEDELGQKLTVNYGLLDYTNIH